MIYNICSMYYRSKKYPTKVKKRIMRHKRTRYHNDAALFPDNTMAYDRKRRKSLKQKDYNDDDSFVAEQIGN